MRIRLHGTRAETALALAALAEVLDVRTVSRPYPDHQSPMFQRIYIEATLHQSPKEMK